MNKDRITYLLTRFENKQLSGTESDELLTLLNSGQYNDVEEAFSDLLAQNAALTSLIPMEELRTSLANIVSVDKVTAIHSPVNAVAPVHRIPFLRRWGWVAASVIICFGIGAYLWTSTKKNTQPAIAVTKTVEIAPGKDGAILTLADGRKLVLDSLGNGVIASQNGSEVILKNGQLAYDLTGNSAGETAYNTMSTPKGRQFRLALPDGTQVWLNAASSIRYPTVFTGTERLVEITGEAYFEVAKNREMPFRLSVNNNAEVEVLGTSFNVNAYKEEASINTTLIEGAVQVSQKIRPGNVVLRPGQQAQIMNAGDDVSESTATTKNGIKVINHADIDKVMAWKNGLFNFEGASFEEVMRQLERWYDIEVTYEKGIPNIQFEGKLTKDISLNGLLNALERSDVHFRIEGRKLIVMP